MKKLLCVMMGILLLVLMFDLAVAAVRGPIGVSAGKVVIGVPSLAAESPNPYSFTGRTDMNYLDLIYNRLAWVGLDGSPDPKWGVASSWQMGADGQSYIFKIHQGIKFHNGDSLTAEDVKFSIEKLVAPETKAGNSPWYRNIVASVDVLDTYTARVNMKSARPLFITADLIDRGLWIVPKRYFEKVGDAEFKQHPVGSGPYKLVSQAKGEYMEFEAFDGYWRGTPYVKTVRLEIIPEDATRLAKLKTGEIDIMTTVPPQMKSEIEAKKGLRTVSVQGTCSNEVNLNKYWKAADTWGAPLMKTDVRLALNCAIDREGIAKSLYQGEAKPAVTLVDRTAYGANLTLKPYPYDPKKARELLAKAGYPNGFKYKIFTAPSTTMPGSIEMAQILQSMWADIGVQVSVVQMDFGTATKKAGAGELDGGLVIANACGADAWSRIYAFSVSTSVNGGCPPDPAWEAQLKDASVTLDPAQREEKIKQLDKLQYDNALHIPLLTGNTIYGVGARVGDWSQASGNPLLRNVELLKLKD